MKILGKIALLPVLIYSVVVRGPEATPLRPEVIHYDGADWRLRGEGVVACPCQVPCPCRHNGSPTYGHCEATLYLQIREGHYGAVSLNNLRLVQTSGPCAMDYQKLAALYFDSSSTPEQQLAFMRLVSSFFPTGVAEFPYVRTVPIEAEVTEDRFFRIVIPGVLQMSVDRNWGRPTAPMPPIAACDHFSNTLQYSQNIRYGMHDNLANVDFDYSNRQANYRTVELDISQYRSGSMLVQHVDRSGWFNEPQLQLIREQHLALPDLEGIREAASRLRRTRREGR